MPVSWEISPSVQNDGGADFGEGGPYKDFMSADRAKGIFAWYAVCAKFVMLELCMMSSKNGQ